MFFKKKPYHVKMRGRSKIVYSEGSKKMNLVSEMMVDDGIVIYTAGLDRWDPPDDKVPISDKEQSRIQKNISEDFMRDQIPVTWV